MMRQELPKGELTMIIGSRAIERRSGSQQLHFRYKIGSALISSPWDVNYRERVGHRQRFVRNKSQRFTTIHRVPQQDARRKIACFMS